MSRFITLFVASCMMLFATEIPIQKAKLHPFNTSVELNAQIIQLSNAKESIASLISGHLERYYVKPAQMIKKISKNRPYKLYGFISDECRFYRVKKAVRS